MPLAFFYSSICIARMSSAVGVGYRPFFAGPKALNSRRWAWQSGRQRNSAPEALAKRDGPLINPKLENSSSASRRQTLLLGAAPVWCCAACSGSRNKVVDKLFAESMATGMAEYETAIAPLKRQLFGQLADGLRQQGDSPARVLEIGIGTGPNISYYPRNGVAITGVDPNPEMLPYLQENIKRAGWPQEMVSWVEGTAEALPLPDASVDAVVCTLVLCSVANIPDVLQQVQRVLRPGGSFLFIEHTAAPQGRPLLQLSQWLLDPLQQLLADGCHLTRDPLPAIQAAGFASVEASRLEVEGMGLIGPHVAGIARL